MLIVICFEFFPCLHGASALPLHNPIKVRVGDFYLVGHSRQGMLFNVFAKFFKDDLFHGPYYISENGYFAT